MRSPTSTGASVSDRSGTLYAVMLGLVVIAVLAYVVPRGVPWLYPYETLTREYLLQPSDAWRTYPDRAALERDCSATQELVADVDGDGREDELVVRVGDRGSSAVVTLEFAGGASREFLHPHMGGFPWDDRAVATILGDVDGDAVRDVAVGSWDFDYGLSRLERIPLAQAQSSRVLGTKGGLWVFSGADGRLILAVSGGRSAYRLGTEVLALPDVDGDGLADVAAVDEDGACHVFRGVPR